MDVKPVRTKRDYKAALKRIDQIIDAAKGSQEYDELDVLSTLVEVYEDNNYSIFPPDPIEAIKFRMEQLGMTKSDLAPYLGGSNRVTEILNRTRKLTVKMIRSLHENLHIPAETLISG